jgi:biopolymer transport protein ExbD
MNFRDDTNRLQPLTLFSQSSLTDIILLLLIFFLLTSSFVTNFGIKVNVPKAETASVTEPTLITVVISEDGDFYMNGAMVPRASLGAEIQREAAAAPGATLVIRADKNSIVDHSVAVMNIGKALQIPIVIATEKQ